MSVLGTFQYVGQKYSAKNKVSKADLAFIDAAIQMQQASLMQGVGPSVAFSDPAACDVVEVAGLAVAAAVIAYHAWTTCMIGASAEELASALKVEIKPTVSLEKMIEIRNQLAKALGA